MALRDPQANGHGYTLTPTANKVFNFIPKDKAVTTWSSGNIGKKMVKPEIGLNSGLMWLWRFNLDPIHAKMTAKKPFLAPAADLALEKDKPVKLTKSLSA